MHVRRLGLLLAPVGAVAAVLTVIVGAFAATGTPQADHSVPPTATKTALGQSQPSLNQFPRPPAVLVLPRVPVHATPVPRPAGAVRHTAPPAPVTTVARHTAPPAAPVPVAPPAAPVPAPVLPPAPRPAPVAPRPVSGDDYPYRYASGSQSDPWGFTERQCVSFVAWRLSQAGRPLNNATDGWGSALTWADAARRHGDTVSTTPSVGSVAQWGAGESSDYYSPGSSYANGRFTASGYGHVAWVRFVYADGSVLVEQYNLGENRSYSVMHARAPRFLRLG